MNITTPFDKILDRYAVNVYYWLLFIIYFFYITAFLGFSFANVIEYKYAHFLSIFIQTFIAFVLIYRFHPFRTHSLNQGDIAFIFGSAVFLLTNVGLTEWVKRNAENDLGISWH